MGPPGHAVLGTAVARATCSAGCAGTRACAAPDQWWLASAGRLPPMQCDGQVSASCMATVQGKCACTFWRQVGCLSQTCTSAARRQRPASQLSLVRTSSNALTTPWSSECMRHFPLHALVLLHPKSGYVCLQVAFCIHAGLWMAVAWMCGS